MNQIISLHIGQCGIQIANACWELFCLEHGIQLDGQPISNNSENKSNVFFDETEKGEFIPRAVLADADPNIIDEIQFGNLKNLYTKSQLISGVEDGANIFMRSHYGTGRAIIDQITDKIRKLAENCKKVKGFLFTIAAGGGTGSGLGCLLLERLSCDFGKTPRVGFAIYPSTNICNSVLEVYNAALTNETMIEHAEACVIMDNESLYDISKNMLETERSNYSDLNQLIAQQISSLTASLRFPSALNVDLNEFQANLVPYPRLHFLTCSYSPFVVSGQAYSELISTNTITNALFSQKNQFLTIDPRNGKYMACSLFYRGDVTPFEARFAIDQIKSKSTIQFVDWCPTGFKVAINYQRSVVVANSNLAQVSKTASMIANSTALLKYYTQLRRKYDLVYARRALVHAYVSEGMEESQLTHAIENLAAIQKDYEEVVEDADEEEE